MEALLEEQEAATPSLLLADSHSSPDMDAEKQDLLEVVIRIIQEKSTEKQRQAIMAIISKGMAMDEIAKQTGSQPQCSL